MEFFKIVLVIAFIIVLSTNWCDKSDDYDENAMQIAIVTRIDIDNKYKPIAFIADIDGNRIVVNVIYQAVVSPRIVEIGDYILVMQYNNYSDNYKFINIVQKE